MSEPVKDPLAFGTADEWEAPDMHFGSGYGDFTGDLDTGADEASGYSPVLPKVSAVDANGNASASHGAAGRAETSAAAAVQPAPSQMSTFERVDPRAHSAPAAVSSLRYADFAPANPGKTIIFNASLQIVVHSPKKTYGPSAIPGVEEFYMTYEVTTVTTLQLFSSSQLSVRRRFKDFVSLSALLPQLYPGYFLPVRPQKNVYEGKRASAQFVEKRRAELERYMNRLAAHDAVARSEALCVFLEVDGNLRTSPRWVALFPRVPGVGASTARFLRQLVVREARGPSATDAARPALASRDVFRLLREQVTALTSGTNELRLTSQEERLRDAAGVLEDKRRELMVGTQKCDALVLRFEELGANLKELASCLNALYRFENDHWFVSGQPCAIAAQGAGRAAQLTSSAAEYCHVALAAPLADMLHTLPSCLLALHTRERQLLTVATLQADLRDRTGKREHADITPGTPIRRVDSLRRQIASLDTSLTSARAEYDRLAERNSSELDSFKEQRSQEILGGLIYFASVQATYWQHIEEAWQQVINALGPDKMMTAYMAQKTYT